MNRDLWAEHARYKSMEPPLSPNDRLIWHHLKEFLEEWEFSASRSVRPSAWDSLRAALVKGERDERVLLNLITPYGPGGEEVLRVIQAVEAYQWLIEWGGCESDKRENRGESWWSYPQGFLPHLGGPFHQNLWGEIRSSCTEGRFNRAYALCRHPRLSRLPTRLANDWHAEVQEKLLPYVFQAKKRAPFVPRLPEPLPPGLRAEGHCIPQADDYFLGKFEEHRTDPPEDPSWRAIRPSMWGHIRALVAVAATLTPLPDARAVWRGPPRGPRQSFEVQYRPDQGSWVRTFKLEGRWGERDVYQELFPLDLGSCGEIPDFFEESQTVIPHLESAEQAAEVMQGFWGGFLSKEILRRWG